MSALHRNGLDFLFVKSTLSRNPNRLFAHDQKHHPQSIGTRIRITCEELGPTFVKIGQILSTRTDIISQSVAVELQKLQDDVPAFPFADAKQILEEEFSAKIEDIFAEFDETPVASASVSQVYRARLHSGIEVAVKVQRPNIANSIITDLSILEGLAKLVDKYSKYGQLYDFTGMVKDLRRVLEAELDFVKEGESIELFQKTIAGHPNIKVPKVRWVYTCARVLTMEFVHGIKINDIAGLERQDANKTALARDFISSLLRQILESGVFHADPHPGNVFVIDGKTIEFIDLGMIGTINTKFRRLLNDLLLGLSTQNTRKIAQTILEMDQACAEVNQRQFEHQLTTLLDEYLYKPLGQVNIAKVFTEVFALAGKHKMKIPREFAFVAKALGTAQGVIELLDPELNILTIAERTVKDILQHYLSSKEFRMELESYALDSADLLREAPGLLLSFINKLKSNDFAINLRLKNLERIERNLESVFNRISFAVVLLGVCIVMAGIIIGVNYSMSARDAAAMQDFSFFALRAGVLFAGIIFAGIMISIFRSGRGRKGD